MFSSSKSCRGIFFLRAVFLPTDNGYPRLGLAIGKKLGKAHERNLVKRYCREWFRTRAPKEGSFDLLITSLGKKKTCGEKEFKEKVRKDFKKLSSIFPSGMS